MLSQAAPAGPAQVLEAIEADRPGFRFMGTDVACSQVDKHKAKHASKAGQWAFQCVDYANEPLPRGYELVFSRDSLQHIPLHGVWQFLNNVKASGAKYLLVGGGCGALAAALQGPCDLCAAPGAALQAGPGPWLRRGRSSAGRPSANMPACASPAAPRQQAKRR